MSQQESIYARKREEWLDCLNSNHNVRRREAFRELVNKQYLNPTIKKIIADNFFKGDSRNEKLSSLFYNELCRIIKECQSNDFLSHIKLIDESVKFLCIMYFYFVEEDEDLYELISEQFKSPVYFNRLNVATLLAKIFEKKWKANQTQVQIMDVNNIERYFQSKNNRSVILYLYDLICDTFKVINFKNEQTKDKTETKIYKIYEIFIITELFQHELKLNVETFQKESLKNLIDCIFRSNSYSQLNSLSLAIIEIFLKYGNLIEYEEYLNLDLLNKINECINYEYIDCVNSGLIFEKPSNASRWKDLKNIYNTVLVCFEKKQIRSNNMNQTKIISNSNINFKNEQKDIDNKWFNSKFHEFSRSTKEIYNSNREKTFISLSLENDSLVKDNEELEKNLKNAEHKLNDFAGRLDELKKEKELYKQRCDELSRRNLENNQPIKKVEQDSYDENKIELTEPKDKIEAEKYILNLNRKNMNSNEFRSVANLNHNLYKNKDHFFSEILQNFDDNEYEISENSCFAKIILDKNFILFSNNEIGFSVVNVEALCNISSSKKELGIKTGNKGIGFKSVFVCSDNPIIISNKWQFQFKADKKKSSSYVTPYYLKDTEIEYDLFVEKEKNPANTYIYLPLNKKFSKTITEISEPFNPFVLLFTKNLNEIIVENNIIQKSSHYECNKKSVTKNKIAFETLNEDFSNLEHYECILKCTGQRDEEISFDMYEIDLKIPSDLREEIDLKVDKIKLSIGFPLINSLNNKFHVFNVLPVEDLGFKFVINAYWLLTTNRDGISDSYNYNFYLRDCLEEFFYLIVTNQPKISSLISLYMANKSELKLNGFWGEFYDNLLERFRPIFQKNLNKELSLQNERKTIKILDDKLKRVLDQDILDMLNIKLIEANKETLRSGYQMISINDILKCFKSSNPNSVIKNDEFWDEFFKILYYEYLTRIQTCDNVFDQIKEFNLFLVQIDDQENIKRSNLENNPIEHYYLNKDMNLKYYWNDNLKIINYKSINEKNFLEKILKLAYCNRMGLIEFTLINQQYKNIYLDLKFIKDNYKEYKNLNFDLYDKYELKLPTIQSDNLINIKSCILSSLFGISLKDHVENTEKYLIDFETLKVDKSLKEILEWEYFFIDLICDLPDNLVENYQGSIECIHKTENILNNFYLLDESSIKLASKILDRLKETRLLKWFSQLPIKISDTFFVPLNKTFAKHLYKDYLPSIDIPTNALNFYSNLGVNTILSFETCIKVLETLVAKKVYKTTSYIEWLNNLSMLVKENTQIKYELVCLSDINDQKLCFYKSEQIYCISDDCDKEYLDKMKLVCKYTKKTIINSKFNSEYSSFKHLFLFLGANNSIELSHILDAVCNIRENFTENNGNFRKIIKNKTILNDLIDLFLQLEDKLKELDSNLDKKNYDMNYKQRQWLSENETIQNLLTKDQKEKLYLINKQNEIIENWQEYKIFCSFDFNLDSISENFSQKQPYTCEFINSIIAKYCPILVSYFEVNFMETYIQVLNTKEIQLESNKEVNKILRQNNIRFQNNIFVTFKFMKEDSRDLLKWKLEKEKVTNEKKYSTFSKKNFIILHENALIFSNCYIATKESILTSFEKYNIIIDNKNNIDDIIDKIKNLTFEYENSVKNKTLFLIENILFLDRINFNLKKRKTFRKINNLDISDYLKRIDEIKITNEIGKENYPSSNRTKYYFINQQEQELAGILAEQIFDLYLERNFKSYDPSLNWKSSARNESYPELKNGNDDSLGYDFEINDDEGIFLNEDENKKCYLEVKGSLEDWDNSFYISQNENNKMNSFEKEQEKYFFIIIENIQNPNKLKIRSIDYSKNKDLFEFIPKIYLVIVNKDRNHKKEIQQVRNSSIIYSASSSSINNVRNQQSTHINNYQRNNTHGFWRNPVNK